MSLRRTLQTFNHSMWAAKNASRLVKSSIGAAKSAHKGIRNLRRRLANGPKSNVVASVQKRTRGSIDPKFFNKTTPSGVARRMKLAAQLRAQRKTAPPTKPGIPRTRSTYPGTIKLERGMTGAQLRRRVTAYRRRSHVKDMLAQHQGDRKQTAQFIRTMRQQGVRPKFKTNEYDPLYKKAVRNYTRAFK